MKKRKYIKLLISFLLLFSVGYTFYKNDFNITKVYENININDNINNMKFNNCLKNDFIEEMKSNELIALETEIKEYSSLYDLSYKFKTLNNDYILEHQTSTVYFAASLYKLLDLIYLIELENAGKIDLDETVKYSTSSFISYSEGMKNIKNNTLISLRELLSYAIKYSDNTAHNILVSYIGRNKLRDLGKSLGAKNLMNQYGYGMANINEIMLYLDKVYELINLNNDNSEFIKVNMNNDWWNKINIPESRFYHKWGGAENYFHNIGISIDNNYMIIIMSKIRHLDYTKVFNQLSTYFYNLNNEINNSKSSYCYNSIYNIKND